MLFFTLSLLNWAVIESPFSIQNSKTIDSNQMRQYTSA